MILDPEACYRALSSRDPRFDGVFFVGVTTTGIYCRPVCPARLPRFERCRFFRDAGTAEARGFRPCMRCRPERAPGRAIVDATRNLASRAAARIAAGALNGSSVERLASELHVGARQLRRALRQEYGITPVELAQTHRLLLAKRLLAETNLRVTDVAFASGFSSVRRFNALFRTRYRMKPSELRRNGRSVGAPSDPLALRLDYRPPLDWKAMMAFLEARAIPGVERVEGAEYSRTVSLDGHRGWIVATPGRTGGAVELGVSLSLLPVLMPLLARVRTLFDLDAEPAAVGEHLSRDPLLRPALRRRPGLRVPGAVCGFELAWRAVLGQQVSVGAATTLAGRLTAAFGEEIDAGPVGLSRLPVEAARLARVEAGDLARIGIPRSRAACIVHLARAVQEGRLRLEPGADVATEVRELERIPGIGPWTAQYVAMRALHWPDAFPESDLGLRKAVGGLPASELRTVADPWRPWRAYAALHLWASLADPHPNVHPHVGSHGDDHSNDDVHSRQDVPSPHDEEAADAFPNLQPRAG